MTTTGSELATINLAETRALSKELSASQLIPHALKKKPEDVLAIVLTGAEIGLQPMQALRGIHIINGKPTLSADVMGALVMRSSACEYLTPIENTAKVCTYETKRKGSPALVRMGFTIEEAKAAGLTSNPNWQKFPAAMLKARAVAAICRAVYPDLILGLYDSDSGELTNGAPTDVQISDSQPQAAHVASVKEALKGTVSAPAKGEVVEGEIVESVSVEAAPTMTERIASAATLDELEALRLEIGALPLEEKNALRGPYKARVAALKEVA